MGPKNKPPMQRQGEVYCTIPLERFLDATYPDEYIKDKPPRDEIEQLWHLENVTLLENLAADGWLLKQVVQPVPQGTNGYAIYSKSALFEFRPDPATEDKK